jgi:hypothetical protein
LWFDFALDTPDLHFVPFDSRYGTDENAQSRKRRK